MPHMVAQEHLAWVDAVRYGTARNHTTIAAALSAIGSQPMALVLTCTGDGVWTIGANLIIPVNVLLIIPTGSFLNVSSGVTLTLNGQIMAWRAGWFTGAGTLVFGSVPPYSELHSLQARSLSMPVDATPIVLGLPYAGSGITTGRQIALVTQNGANSVGISFRCPPSGGGPGSQAIWDVGEDAFARFYVVRPSAHPQLVINDAGVGIVPGLGHAGGGNGAITPAFSLHLLVDSAAKPGTNTWTVSSDERIKEVLGDYEQGLPFLRSLPPPKRYRYNGKAHTPVNGAESVNFIAQELQPIAPSWVGSYEDKLDDSDPAPTDILTVNSNDLIFALLNAVKELATRVDALETRLDGIDPTHAYARLDGLESVAHDHSGSGNAGSKEGYTPPTPAATAQEEAHPRRPARRKHG